MSILRVIDLETTGLEAPAAEVVEVGYCDFDREAGEVLTARAASYLCGVSAIPPEVRAVHHIYMEDVAGLPRFDPEQVLALALKDDVAGFAAHQAEFESQWIGRVLDGVLPLICTYKAALRIWPDAPSHSNFALLYWLQDAGKVSPTREKLTPSHRSLPDAYATAHVLQALFADGATGRDMIGWTREPALLPRCPLNPHRGKPWPEVDHGFLRWIIGKDDIAADIRWNATRELDRRISQ